MFDRLRMSWAFLITALALASGFALAPTPARAQGFVAWDVDKCCATHKTNPNDHLGELGTAPGVATPRGFRESTPTVTGMPPSGYDAEIEYSNGLTDLEFGCYMQAREDFRHALSVQPKMARAWFLLGVAYNSTGDRAAAAGAYEKALKFEPQMLDAKREWAVSLALQGQTAKAQALLDNLKRLAAGCAEGCADADLLKTSVARVEAALSGQLTEVMRPVAASAVCSALATKAARNCFAAAKFGDLHGNGIGDCTAAIASGLPDEVRTRVLVNRGVIRLADNKAAHAIEDFDKAIALNGQIGDAYTNRGAAHLSMKQFDEARADIDKGLAIGSAEPQRAYYNRGLADEHLGDNKSAYLDFLKAAKLDPNWEAPKGELARFSVEER
jgi:tetratricopeptide (TPR) repeat protein